MFKHFLTHQLAEGFDRSCQALNLAPRDQEEVRRCSRNMLLYFNKSIRTTEPKERAKFLFVALTYLRDCQEILKAQKEPCGFEVVGRYQVLEGRLEQLFWESSEAENGQLRMLG